VQNVLNVQPVIPLQLNENWNLITRTIIPLIYQPELAPGYGDEFGFGDINMSLFLSPAKPARSFGASGRFFPCPPQRMKCWVPKNGVQAPRQWR